MTSLSVGEPFLNAATLAYKKFITCSQQFRNVILARLSYPSVIFNSLPPFSR